MKIGNHSNHLSCYLALLIAGAWCCQSSGVPINLVKNGSFEVGFGYSNWTLSQGGLLNLGGPGAGVQCADGYNAVGLGWQSTLSQNVTTVVGQRYDFSFYMADWGPDSVPANIVSLDPSFGSTALGTLSFNGAGKSYRNMGWERFDFLVTATSTSTLISFFNPGAFNSDTRWSMIDNVVLTPVPDHSGASILILSALFLGSFGHLQRRLKTV